MVLNVSVVLSLMGTAFIIKSHRKNTDKKLAMGINSKYFCVLIDILSPPNQSQETEKENPNNADTEPPNPFGP